MKLSEILSIARRQYLNDVVFPYRWADAYLTQCVNEAENEAAKRAKFLCDNSTQTANNVASGAATSTTANKLVDTGAAFTTAMVGFTVYNTTDNTFATVTARDSATILSLSADIMVSGEAYVIGDASKAIARVCVVDGTSTYALSSKVFKVKGCYLNSDKQALIPTTEGWLERNYSGWRSATGTPRYYVEERGQIMLVPQPASSLNNGTGKDMLYLSVYRLPLVALSQATDGTPEIPEEFHFALVYWVCALAYAQQDANAVDANKASWHEMQFENKFGRKMSAHDEEMRRKLVSNFTFEKPFMGL